MYQVMYGTPLEATIAQRMSPPLDELIAHPARPRRRQPFATTYRKTRDRGDAL